MHPTHDYASPCSVVSLSRRVSANSTCTICVVLCFYTIYSRTSWIVFTPWHALVTLECSAGSSPDFKVVHRMNVIDRYATKILLLFDYRCFSAMGNEFTSTPSLNQRSSSEMGTSFPLICLFRMRPSSLNVQSYGKASVRRTTTVLHVVRHSPRGRSSGTTASCRPACSQTTRRRTATDTATA